MKRSNSYFVCTLFVSVLVVFFSPAVGRAQWEPPVQLTYNAMEDEALGAGQHSLVIGSEGNVHLIWFAGSEYLMHQIFYATNASGSWVTTQLTNTPLYNMWPAIAIDSSGAIHAVWVYMFKLTYATNQSGNWETSSIAPIYSANHSSIALDSNQDVHIVCTNPYPGLVYITNESGDWIPENIAIGISNEWPTIGIDPSNGIHIAWLRGESEESYQIFYATNISGQWVTSQLTSSSRGNQMPSLGVGQLGFIHIVWTREVDDTTSQLFYATDVSGHWETTQVTNSPGFKFSPSLAVNPSGFVHIAWTGEVGDIGQIFYANNCNGYWVIDQVTDSDSTCAYPNIAVDADTVVHIAYCSTLDGGDLDIFYLKSSGPITAVEGVNPTQFPESFKLFQNYPNPFNPSTTIRYQIPDARHKTQVRRTPDSFGDARRTSSHVSLKIYNLLGQVVKTLVNEKKGPGYYTVTWDGQDREGDEAASGVYFCQLQAGKFVKARKMLLIK